MKLRSDRRLTVVLIQVEVTAVMKSHNSNDWIVSYKRIVPGRFDLEEQTVRATFVILGAGAIGSTKILLRSKERGLDVSDEVGKRFSTNGDVFGFSYNGDKEANSVGVETKNITTNIATKRPTQLELKPRILLLPNHLVHASHPLWTFVKQMAAVSRTTLSSKTERLRLLYLYHLRLV